MSILLRMYPGDAWAFLIANVLVQATVVILTAWLLARLGSRWNAAWRHSIYLVALICVLASPALWWVMQSTGTALLTLRPSAPIVSPAEPARIPMAHITRSSPIEMPAKLQPVTPQLATPQPAPPQIAESRPRREAESRGQSLQSGTPPAYSLPDILRALGGVALVIWLSGMALLLTRWCYAMHLIAALRRSARPLDCEAMSGLLLQVHRALGAGKLPPMAVSAGLDRPVMVGLVRPLVILPEDVLRTLNEAELADVLVHECAHAVCRHQVVGLLQRVAGMLFWPHPLVHMLNRELARAREEVCDNYVLRRSDAPRYARTLLELSQLLVGVSPKPTTLGLFHCHWRLEDRVADLLDRRRRAMIRVSRWTAAALTATFLLLALLVAGTKVVQAEPAADKDAPAGAKIIEKTTEKTIEKTTEKTIEEKTATPPAKDGKSQASSLSAAEKIEHRAINKLVKDFPEKTDLSTPESAMVAFGRNMARNDIRAALDLSWVKMDAQIVKDIEYAFKHDPNAPKDLSPLFLDTEIFEVLTYHDDFAAVIYKGNLDGKGPSYEGAPFGKINGVWKFLGLGFSLGDSPKDWSSQSDKAVIERVEQKKDELWRQFAEIRNEVLNGRTPMFDMKGRTKKKAASVVEMFGPADQSSPDRSPAAADSKSQAPSLSAAEKEQEERMMRKFWRLVLNLDAPNLSPQAVQYAIRDEDPVPAFVKQVKQVRNFYRRQLDQADNEAGKERVRDSEMTTSWDFGFREITADRLYLLVDGQNPDSDGAGMSSNSPEGKKWIVTKTVNLQGKHVCWCIPVEVKTGKKIEVTVSENNTFDLRTVFDNAMQEPAGASEMKTWQIAFDLDVPSLSPQAVQYTILDENPVPAFITQIKRMRNHAREQLEKAHNDVEKEQVNGIQMEVGWDFLFKDITGNKIHLLTNTSNASMMSNEPSGKKWIVTKVVHVKGKPVCWCMSVEVKNGELVDVSFNEKNKFDLRTIYDKAMQEPAGTDDKE